MLKVPMRGRSRPLLGPGLMITAAFIGPGTITTCTLAGSDFGYTLLWVLVFASLATFILQEMSGRLAVIGGIGLGEALDQQLHSRFTRFIGISIVICAVGAGNAAYQTGNFLGASLGLAALTGTDIHRWPVILGIISFLLLWFGSYKTLERVLGGFVALMSLCFVLTAVMAGPEIGSFLKGMFIPRLSEDSLYVALGLVGTTIVPYNLFLYSSIIRETWSAKGDLRAARFDLFIAVLVGGGISMAIMTTASAAFFQAGAPITSAADLAIQLEPLLGNWAKATIAIGLFGAGMSSAIAAPLATAYAISGILGWKAGFKDRRFRLVWMAVLLSGCLLASIGLQPLIAILFAQVANGILLPFVAIFLLWVANNRHLLGENVNSWKANLAGSLVIATTLILGIRAATRAFGML